MESFAEEFQLLRINYVDKAKCNSSYDPSYVKKIPDGLADHQICALGMKVNGKSIDTCSGDSGCELFINFEELRF